jgi:hypothetical protein
MFIVVCFETGCPSPRASPDHVLQGRDPPSSSAFPVTVCCFGRYSAGFRMQI